MNSFAGHEAPLPLIQDPLHLPSALSWDLLSAGLPDVSPWEQGLIRCTHVPSLAAVSRSVLAPSA